MSREPHNRRSIRLPDYDYTTPGVYFVTICTYQKQCLLGQVSGNQVSLTLAGQVVARCWEALPRHFHNLEIDQFIVMPNHLHGVLMLQAHDTSGVQSLEADRTNGCSHPRAQSASRDVPNGTRSSSIGAIVQNFKSVSARKLNRMHPATATPVWQRNYYDRVIRNEAELQRIREYIENNPLAWELDELHP